MSDLTEKKVARLVLALGLDPAEHAGAPLAVVIDENWVVAINGNEDTLTAAPRGCMPMPVEADEMCFWYRGWFAGWLRPARRGPGLRETGIVAVEDAASVHTLRAALDAAIVHAVGRSAANAVAPGAERELEPVRA